VPIAEPLFLPMIRSPSQLEGLSRLSAQDDSRYARELRERGHAQLNQPGGLPVPELNHPLQAADSCVRQRLAAWLGRRGRDKRSGLSTHYPEVPQWTGASASDGGGLLKSRVKSA
jgi:hypothetical protein